MARECHALPGEEREPQVWHPREPPHVLEAGEAGGPDAVAELECRDGDGVGVACLDGVQQLQRVWGFWFRVYGFWFRV